MDVRFWRGTVLFIFIVKSDSWVVAHPFPRDLYGYYDWSVGGKWLYGDVWRRSIASCERPPVDERRTKLETPILRSWEPKYLRVSHFNLLLRLWSTTQELIWGVFWGIECRVLRRTQVSGKQMSFSLRTRGDVGFQLCRHFVSLRGSFALVYSASSAADSQGFCVHRRLFSHGGSESPFSVEFHVFLS